MDAEILSVHLYHDKVSAPMLSSPAISTNENPVNVGAEGSDEDYCEELQHPEEEVNGRSLSGMGLIRERWCCAGCWWSRLDMNTCQTSINIDILL